jgi:hypothetical protein
MWGWLSQREAVLLGIVSGVDVDVGVILRGDCAHVGGDCAHVGAMSRPSHQRSLQLEVRAREMRLCPTLSEARLWQALRGSRLGVAFAGRPSSGTTSWISWRRLFHSSSKSTGAITRGALPRRCAARSVSRACRGPCALRRGAAGDGGFAGGARTHRRAARLRPRPSPAPGARLASTAAFRPASRSHGHCRRRGRRALASSLAVMRKITGTSAPRATSSSSERVQRPTSGKLTQGGEAGIEQTVMRTRRRVSRRVRAMASIELVRR